MNLPTQQDAPLHPDCTGEELQALRREMEDRFQRVDRELARARGRIRELENRLDLNPNRIGYTPP